jgi:membrane-bound ClpP family serine protease
MPAKKPRQALAAFVLFSIVEETFIGALAILAIVLLVPQFVLPGVICVALGLATFTLVKIHYFLSSAAIPVDDSIVAQVARVRNDFRPTVAGQWTGRVQVRGESWLAIADEAVAKGSLVRITGMQGLRVSVVPIPSADNRSTTTQAVKP